MARTLLGHDLERDERTMTRTTIELEGRRRCPRVWAGAETSTAAAMAILLGAAIAGSTACGGIAEPRGDEPSGAEGREVEVAKGPSGWTSARAPSCDAPTPLLVHRDSAGHVDRVHASLTARDRPGYFLLDTGSLRSFATYEGNESSSTAKTVIACSATTLPIIARLRPGSTPDGAPQSGVLGSDLMAHGSVLDLDLRRGTLGWYQPAPKAPPGSVVLPIEWRNGWLVASGIVVDGRSVKLVVDTGSTNIIWLDGTPRAGEVREETVDGTANKVVLFHGEGRVKLGDGETLPLPVDRTDDFATLKSLAMSLGGDVDGLLGMTALGRDRVILGRDALVIVPPVTPK